MSLSEYIQKRNKIRGMLSRGILQPDEFVLLKRINAMDFRRLNNRPAKIVGSFRCFEGFSPF